MERFFSKKSGSPSSAGQPALSASDPSVKQSGSSSSVAQPAVLASPLDPGNAAHIVLEPAEPNSAEQPVMSRVYKFDAYNLGWNITDKERSARWLGEELVQLWRNHQFDAIGLSEIFEVDYPKGKLEEVNATRREILSELLARLNADASGGWLGRQDGHCMYISHRSLNLVLADYISLGVESQPWRKSQYFCFHPQDAEWPLHVYHAHCPSPGKKKPGKQDRRFGETQRKTVVKTVWRHALQRHALQQQDGVEQPAFPAVLVTGDWNLPPFQWRSFLHKILPEKVAEKVQVVQSTSLGNCKHGDLTISINCQAFQEETADWTTFSDAHDVVIAPVRLLGLQELLPPGRVEQPAAQAPLEDFSPGRSAEQPDRQTENESEHNSAARDTAVLPAMRLASYGPTASTGGLHADHQISTSKDDDGGESAEQPARQAVNASDHQEQPEVHVLAENLDVPLSGTPLYAQMVDNLASVDDDAADSEALADFERTFMFGNIMGKPVPGHWDQSVPNRMVRLEWVLELLQERRNAHMHRLGERNDPRLSAAQPDFVFSDNDMREIMNDWVRRPEMWMRPDSFSALEHLRSETERHDFVKSRYSVMKFQLLGNQALVDYIIRFNLCGAVQPVALQEFCHLWEKETRTEEHKKAQELSQKQAPGHIRRAKKIWILKQKIQRATWIVDWVDESWNNWYKLSPSDKDLYYSHTQLRDELKDTLRNPAAPRNPGVASHIAAGISRTEDLR